MKSLKSIIQSKLYWISAVMAVLIVLATSLGLVFSTQLQARENANAAYVRLERIINESNTELERITEEYYNTCILNAQVVSYVIRHNPDIIGDIEQFRQLAYQLEVDEIHIFDDTGRIFTGTHPEYFDFTFETGEQIGFFAPLLEDKSLRLSQEITPNTAEGKLVQYSALWSNDGKYIIQVGMYPDAVLEETEKASISHIFSLIQGAPGVSYFAVDEDTRVIVGSTNDNRVGRTLEDIGFHSDSFARFERGSHVTVAGIDYYCFFRKIEGLQIGYAISNDMLYGSIPAYALTLAAIIIVIVFVMVYAVRRFFDRQVIGKLERVNESLSLIVEGDSDTRLDLKSCTEYVQLSESINEVVNYLISTTGKMSVVLDRANLRIGLYECNNKSKNVFMTEHLHDILALPEGTLAEVAGDLAAFRAKIAEVCGDRLPDMENTYKLPGEDERYIKFEEVKYDNYILGIVMDVTEEIRNLRVARVERDYDLLTGLYNRRGMEARFEELFENYKSMGAGAIIEIDCDNLKEINDTYGHSIGDRYLAAMGALFDCFSAPYRVAARPGGDEFVLLIYGYHDNDAVIEAIGRLTELQDTAELRFDDGVGIPLRFSFGYELTYGRRDYGVMLSTADGYMYKSKRERKKLLR